MFVDKLAGAHQHALHAAGAAQVLGAQGQFGQAFAAQGREPGAAPGGVDLLGRQCSHRRVEVKVDHLQVLLAQAPAGQGRVERQLGGGATEHCHALALEVFQGLDPGTRHHPQIVLDPTGRGAEQAGIQAVGLADDGGQVPQVRQVHLAVGEGLVDHRACALEEIPLDLDALVGEGLFKDLLLAQHIHHPTAAVLGAGTEVGHGNADFLEFVGLGQQRQAAQEPRQGRGGEQADDAFEGKVHGCGSWWQRLRGAKGRHGIVQHLNTINSHFNNHIE